MTLAVTSDWLSEHKLECLFAPELAGKSLTPRVYNALADAYRSRFGAYAGWAQQYLFFAELRRANDYTCE